jgi:flagellar protein FlaG
VNEVDLGGICMRVDSMDATSFVRNVDVGVKGFDSAPRPESKPVEVKELKREIPKGIEDKVLIEAIEKANKASLGTNTSFRYSIHQGTKQIMVKVLDKDTDEVIRELPPEKILDMIAKMWEMAGLFVDEKR